MMKFINFAGFCYEDDEFFVNVMKVNFFWVLHSLNFFPGF